jgi:AcrR family transcriptional regulator
MTTSSPPPAAPAGEDEIRERILRAAFKAFTENGYAGTSTLQIATQAKVSKRDLYAMFASKQAMLVACIKTHLDRMRMPAGLPPPATREALASTLTGFGKVLLTATFHPAVVAMFRLAIAEAERSPEIARAIDGGRKAAGRTVSELVAQAQSLGFLPPGNASIMADRFLALLRQDVMMSLLLGVAAPPSRAKIEARAADATRAFLEIGSASGCWTSQPGF